MWGMATQSSRTGAKTSMTSAPSGPVTTLWGRFDGMRHVPPGPSSRVSPSTVNVTLPEHHHPELLVLVAVLGHDRSGGELDDARGSAARR